MIEAFLSTGNQRAYCIDELAVIDDMLAEVDCRPGIEAFLPLHIFILDDLIASNLFWSEG